MRTTRGVLAGIAVLAMASPSAAFAAHHSNVACDLVRDPAGDAQPLSPAVDAGSLDVVSADVATNATTLTVAIRTVDPIVVDPTDPRSRNYTFSFVANGTGFSVVAAYATHGADYSLDVLDGPSDPASGTPVSGTRISAIQGHIVAAGREIRMTAPLALLRPYASLKQTFLSQLTVNDAAGVMVNPQSVSAGPASASGPAGVVSTVDYASSNARYLPGAPSCI